MPCLSSRVRHHDNQQGTWTLYGSKKSTEPNRFGCHVCIVARESLFYLFILHTQLIVSWTKMENESRKITRFDR